MAPVSEEQIEEYELTIEETIVELTVEELQKLAASLGIPEIKWKEKRKLMVLRSIRQFIENTVEEKEELQDKNDVLDHILAAIEDLHAKRKKPSTRKRETVPIEQKHEDYDREGDMLNESKSREDMRHETLLANLNVLKKDFIINGKVGEPTHEKDIGYLGIVRQMADGVERGYSESEVVAAVLKAVVPRNLRSYLNMKRNLKIAKLSQILRLHYQEKSATELYQEMINMRQEKNENSPSFVIRALETREKIMFASHEEGAITYDKKHVQSLCLSTIESGIDVDVAAIIRPCLDPSMDDIEIMQEVHKAETSIKMRKQKSDNASGISKKAQVSAVGIGQESEVIKMLREMKSSMSSVETLKGEMQELREEVAGMRVHVDQVSTNSRQNNAPQDQPRSQSTSRFTPVLPRFTPQCFSCRQNNRDCDHCYKCGSQDHFARGCRMVWGNGRGLSGRERR